MSVSISDDISTYCIMSHNSNALCATEEHEAATRTIQTSNEILKRQHNASCVKYLFVKLALTLDLQSIISGCIKE